MKNHNYHRVKGDTSRRVISFLLACLMALSVLPVQVMVGYSASFSTEATEPDSDSTVDTTESEGKEEPTAEENSEDGEGEPPATEAAEPEEETTGSGESHEETVEAESTEPSEVTEPSEEPTLPEEAEPTDITNNTEKLTLSFKDWWYTDRDNSVTTYANGKQADYSEFEQDPDAEVWAGVTLEYEAADVVTGDWFAIVLPEQMEQVRVQEGFAAQGMEYVLEKLEEPEHGTKLTVRLCAAETVTGKLPLEFRLTEDDNVSIVLQENADQKKEYVVLLPTAEAEQEPTYAISMLGEEEAGTKPEPEYKTVSISGEITFDEVLNGTDWSSILRPLEFNQKIKLTAIYTDDEDNERTVEYTAQDSLPKGAFYVMLTHDGRGGGSFEIANVPNYVELEDGSKKLVTKYIVTIDVDETALPYYESNSFEVQDMEATATKSTLTLSVKSQTVTLHPEVIGDDTEAVFPMAATFTNPTGQNTGSAELKQTLKPTNKQPASVSVPVGIDFQVVQNTPEGYKFDSAYTVETKTGDQDPETETQTGAAVGTVEDGTNVTITTQNYMQNRSYPFTVSWVDNNNPARPTLTGDNFILEYRTEGGEWTAVTGDSLGILGIDTLPTLDTSNAALSQYSYNRLPSVDANGNPLSYRVVPVNTPSGYTVSANEANNVFTYRQTTTFHASISWLDSGNVEGKRPGELPLKLYRRTANGSYQEVDAELQVTKDGNTWNVTAEGLPRYNDANQEYDYVIVQGTLDAPEPITNYITYYNNGSGNFSNDITLCHNGGTIKQRITDTTEFTATKYWKDDVSAGERPAAAVTLWRYSIPADGNDPGIDAMYNQDLAARVIYRDAASGTDILLSYELSKTNGEEIVFNSTKVSGLPEEFRLPAYDEQGREYVYFVRETVESDNYETVYSGGQAQGTLSGGNVTNIRREKAAVSVNKVWQCPSNLKDIDGASIQMTILMPVLKENGTTEYKELTVYSTEPNSYMVLTGAEKTAAQTVSGFTESIASLDLQFYVNIYDENGQPYDMSKAVIQEITIWDKNGEPITVGMDGTFTLNGNQYTAASAYSNQNVLANGMKEFQYKETNTISGIRDYTLIKNWSASISEEDFSDVQSVNFTLMRRSGRDGADYQTVGTYEVSRMEGRTWETIIADLDKYDEQGYAYQYTAREVSLTKTDNTTVPVSGTGWYVDYFRTEDSTTASNYRASGPSKSLAFSKEWVDNGDVDARQAVTVRIYRKADILAALQSFAEDSIISLDSLTVKYAAYTLSNDNAWYRGVGLASIEEAMTGTAPANIDDLQVTDYLVLEYRVGTGGVPARYSYAQLKSAAESENAYTITGTAYNSSRQYQTTAEKEAASSHIILTNTRIGQVTVVVGKTWKDENNSDSFRPDSVRFQLYQDGVPYHPGEDSGIVVSGQGVTWDAASGIMTVSNTGANANAEVWSFRLENLPLFSDTGVPHTYNVEETGPIPGYTMVKDPTVVTSDAVIPDRVTYQFPFTNTITGSTSHMAYKYWQDAATGGEGRPDLYLTLYRYLKSDAAANPDKAVTELDSYAPYSDYRDQTWTPGEATDPYDWKIVVDELPRYSENGEEYIYRFQEAMNNGGVTVYGTYEKAEETLTDASGGTYEKFTNTLTDTMTYTGEKTWTGFAGYQIEPKDYPTVTIELYRSLDPTINPLNKKDTDSDFQQWIAEGKIEKVAELTLSYDEENEKYPTTYSFGTVGEALPKFNDKGQRYYYTIREVMPDPITDSLYTEESANGTLTNKFRDDVNRRTIQVTKTWSGRERLTAEEDKYPSVTFYLYRYEEGKEAYPILVDTVKIDAGKFVENEEYTHSFENLLIYSPSGKPYHYYVTEKSINGYTISYQDEAGISEGYADNSRSDVISIPENALTSKDHVTNVGTKNIYADPATMTICGSKYWNDYNNSSLIYGKRPDSIEVTLKRYTQNESGQINKVSEEVINLSSGEAGKPYIEWKVSEVDPNYWTYTIYNLERYAPNGMPYIYSVTETAVEGYKQSEQTVSGTAGTEGNLTLNVLTNSLGASYYVRKNWMDGNNKYGLRPTSITVVLQRSLDGTHWQNIPWLSSFGTYDEATKKWTGLPSVTKGTVTIGDVETTTDIVSIKLTADYVIQNTRDNSWEYTFTNLPEKDTDGNTWHYRCIETHIGGAPVKAENNQAGAYTRSYPTQDDEKTVIQNKLESTTLHVTKNWENDEHDLYDSRPDSITFVLQMRGIKQTDADPGSPGEGSEGSFELTSWQNVQLNGSAYTFTITKADNWQKTLEDLPVATVGEDGRTYYALYFRALEVTTDGKVNGALNYQDTTDYTTNYDPDTEYSETNPLPDHYYDREANRNESVITNQLITDETDSTITVTKVWRRETGEEAAATFELLYHAVGETTWHCYGDVEIPAGDPGDWSAHIGEAGCVLQTVRSTEAGSTSVQWKNLPKFDRDGKELVYKVVEHPVEGYAAQVATNLSGVEASSLLGAFLSLFRAGGATAEYPTEYTFTNIELQSYTVSKVWKNTDYAEKTEAGFTATFRLQQQTEGSAGWTDVGDPVTLTSTEANDDTQSHTWENLPKYTADGKQITYRAVETQINGITVANDTNGSYIVTYQYDGTGSPAFVGTETAATNRMVYGFVNLSKAAAYLAPSVTADGDQKLEGVVFDIYSGTGETKTLYAASVVTDANGNLIRNADGTYGDEHRYLISGTYTLMERSTNPDYSIWSNGVTFTVGVSGSGNTGEHGTAWISTTNVFGKPLYLQATYVPSTAENHTFPDGCVPLSSEGNAYNLESRGVIRFTKTDDGAPLDTHAGAAGESRAYFGVYLDEDCTDQVAGMMADASGTTMVLTTLAKDGTENKDTFLAKNNAAGVPYLRKDSDGLLTLLSGTYYLKELVAPPGYKLDNTVRKAIVPHIQATDNDTDLSGIYANNKAGIMLLGETAGTDSYSWTNTENQLTLYKRDQYGRIVTLKDSGYLELKVEGEGNTFLTGENTIRLYQNGTNPAAKADGSAFDTGTPNITYDLDNGCWTIKGLFDIGKTYTLSEPETSVPDNNLQAKPLSFTMGADGAITVTSVDAQSKGNPLEAAGNDYENYYKSDSGNNVVVLRDISRFRKDVALEKLDAITHTGIENISFVLYKYETVGEDGKPVDPQSVLAPGVYLTTDAEGRIRLSNTPAGIQNLITGCDLRYGLDVGKYYFQEVERGASDTYRLRDEIFFEITPKVPTDPADYQDYAKVTFTTGSGVTQSTDPAEKSTGIVENTPVTEAPKTLELTKVDSGNSETKLAGAQFTLTYTSVNNGTEGSHVTTTYYCVTGSDGVLYLRQGNTPDGAITSDQPDISKKGTYVLEEIQAPDNYMTRTPATKVTFKVNSQNEIREVVCSNSLVSAVVVPETGESTKLELTVKDEKTVVSIAKRNDIEGGAKTSDQKSLNGEFLSGAVLEIYEGVGTAGTRITDITEWTYAGGVYTLPAGTLKENTIYTLHESQAPVGYLAAKDIYFKLFGTTTKAGQVVSQLYVWTGTGAATANGTGWSTSTSIQDTALTMVDEAIIAPVDLQKVVGADETYRVLPGAEFKVKSLDGEGTVLGTAVTDHNGHLVWKAIENPNGLIFQENRERVTAADKDSAIGQTIILRQNADGYQFTETYAPDHAYNKGESFTVKISAKNYTDYRDGGYQANVYVDILAANAAESKTVDTLSVRENTPEAADLVNPPFATSFELYKYDAEHPQINPAHNNYDTIGLQGVTFTLYKKQADGTYPETGTAYTTGVSGLLHIDLTEKGTYKLVETAPLTGYQQNSTVLEFTIVNSDYRKTLTYSDTEANHTLAVKDAEGNPIVGAAVWDLPNSRQHGTVTLTKQDADSGVRLNGVMYTLTRTNPAVNANVDKWFPSASNQSITVETGKTYTVVASAADEAMFAAGISAGSSGVLEIRDLQWGTYTLVECQEGDGYILDDAKTFTFTISASGLTQMVTDVGKEFVTNTKNHLTIQKTALDGTALNGAEFTLYPVTKSGETETMGSTPASFYTAADAETAAGTIITAGNTTVYGLTKGTYVLRETKAPEGYELTRDVIFIMSETGKVTAVTTCTVGEGGVITRDASGAAVVTVSEAADKLTVKDTPIEVKLSKAVSDGMLTAERGDASYEIKGVFAGETAESTRTFTGNTITDALKAQLIGGNSYTITETKAPAGYEVQKNSATILVAVDGTISVTAGNAFLTADNTTGTAELTFTDVPIELTLRKTDANGDIDEATLGYAVFRITGKFVSTDGSEIKAETISGLTTANFKDTLSKRLIGGEIYLVEETNPPKGYMTVAPFYIQVNPYGEIVKRGATADNLTEVPPTDTLVVQDAYNTITFQKIDDNGPLAGAKFTLTAESSTLMPAFVNMSGTQPTGVTIWETTKIEWVSGETGITLTNHLIAGVRYKLHEERVANHEVMVSDIIFHLEPNGKVVIDDNPTIPNNSGAAASLSGTVMTIRNPIIRGKVTLTKYWKAGSTAADVYDDAHRLAGAVYTLTRLTDENGASVNQPVKTDASYVYSTSSTVDRFTTDANGQITITGLPEGTYEFREVDAPKAYHINLDIAVPFAIVNGDGANVTIAPDAKVMDTRINASISLTKFSGTAKLAGAVFDVAYSETADGTYTSIGTMTTDANGMAAFPQGTYPGSTEPEGLRRGFYRLTELSADGQMLNTTDGTRNTISFEIGNEINKVYAVKSGTDVTYTLGGAFVSLDENGAVDTPIPTKSVTVTKNWVDDNGLELTFRPESVKVQLYRSYYNGTEDVTETVGAQQELNAGNSWTFTWASLPAYVNDGTGSQKTTFLYTYYVEEVDAKSWYTVTYINETGKTGTQTPSAADGDTASTVTNTLNGGASVSAPGAEAGRKNLTIRKTLGGGSADDAFQVRILLTEPVGNKGYFLDPCKLTKADNTTETVSPDADGWMTIHGGESITAELPNGAVYTVEEKTASGTVTGTVHTELIYTPRYDSNRSGTISTENVTTIRNAVHKSLSLVKQNETGSPLSGAEFTIAYTPLAGSSYVGTAYTETFTTNSDGKIVDSYGKPIDLTNQGTYTIREIKAPAGYITPTDNDGNPVVLATITVNADDIMSVTTSSPLVTVSLENFDSQASVTVKNEKTRARIGKTIDYAAAGITADTAEGSYLAGASLQIKQGETVIASWTTTGTAYVTADGLLKEGTVYTLTEVSAPTGYAKAANVSFKLDGTYTVGGIRYSRVVITDEAGNAIAQNTGGSSYGDPGMISGVLKLVDETIIAPVDLRKVLQESESRWTALENVEFTVSDGTTTFGTAVTNEKGYLIWKTIQNVCDANGEYLIYDTAGLRVTAAGEVRSQNLPVILRQNTDGYRFTEAYAPNHAYNDGRTYHVKITEANYREFRTTSKTAGSLYDLTKYINIVAAEANTGAYTVEHLTVRDNATEFAASDGLAINLPYKSTVTLRKYDADEEAGNASIPGTEFTLYHATVSGDVWTKGAVVTDAYVTGQASPNTTGIFTTDASGNLSIAIHNKGYYILEETKAATGYQLDSKQFRFRLIDDPARPYGYNKTTELNQNATGVPNERRKGTVTLVKTDSGTLQPLNGIVYTLTRTDNPGIPDYLLKTPMDVTTGKVYTASKVGGVWTWSVADGAAGEIQVIGLNWGSYTLVEKTEQSGYVKQDTVHSFTVDETHLTIRFDVTNTKNQVTFHKVGVLDDATEKNLAGAVFEVHEGDTCGGTCTAVSFYASASAADTVTTVTSGEDGTVTIYGLPTDTADGAAPKTYHLIETTAPKGYKIAAPVIFTIDRYGNIQVAGADAAEVVMKDEPIKLYIEKVGETDTVKLSGAEFKLTDICEGTCDHKLANGADMETGITTGADGKVLIPIERVIAGHTYRLEETKAPDGYECTAVVTFQVKADGTAVLLTTAGGYTDAVLDNVTKTIFTISDAQIGLSLTKADYDSPTQAMPGVTFTLKAVEGSSFIDSFVPGDSSITLTKDADDKILLVTLTTDANGKIGIPYGLVKHDNSYILTETSLGSGYPNYRFPASEADRQITVKVEKDGSFTITDPNDMFRLADGDATALVVSNQQITLAVSKLDQATGAPLAGVRLKLSKRTGDPDTWTAVEEWDTDGTLNPKIFKGTGFTPGTYKLEETYTPEGYNAIAGPLIFTIDQTGKVTQAAVGSEGLSGLTGQTWASQNFRIANPEDGKPGQIALTVDNAAYSDLQITKKGSDGALLKDVQLRLDYWDGTQWQYVKLDSSGKAVITARALTAGTAEEAMRTTASDGVAAFGGLPNGKYRLTELKTASGYNLLSTQLVIEINRNGEIYTVSADGTVADLVRAGDSILLTVINQKGVVLPATGTTTPELPIAVLGFTAILECLVLCLYSLRGKRRKKEAKWYR